MQTKTKEMMDRFPVRKNKKQKEEFRAWLIETLTAAGYSCEVERGTALVPTSNVVVGDPEKAEVVYTAHYDTPARLPLPNFIVPRNMLITLICQLPLLLLMFVIPIGAEIAVIRLTDDPLLGFLTLYVLLIGILFLICAGPANPRNVNDNTSGVATLMEIALSLPEEQRENAAFLFFDNEEKGMLGSSAYYKKHKSAMKETLLVNFDCVSDGDAVCFFPNKKLKKQAKLLTALEESFLPQGEKTVEVVRGAAHYPSDQSPFPYGVGVAALHGNRFFQYLGRIHTGRDTVFEPENIELLRRGAVTLTERMAREKTGAAQ